MPVCAPARRPSAPASAFEASVSGVDARLFANAVALWSAPWRAWWAIAFEALDSRNYLSDR
jgi:hypothetical protein